MKSFKCQLQYAQGSIPVSLAVLYPLTVLASVAVAFRSLVFSLTGRLTWKDRPLERPKWKWL